MLQLFGIISGVLSALCYVPYVKDILAGTTKPERASWLIWTVLGSIAFFSQLAKGASASLWLTGVQMIGVTIIFLLSLKYGVGGLVKKDILALLAAGVGLILWWLTREAAIALLIVIFIDTIGAVLTVLKAYQHPESETLMTWLLAGIAGFFAAFAVGEANFILLSYPLYTAIINSSVVAAMYFGKRKKHK
jgi:hypothetical protein